MSRLVIVADDLAGAADTAVPFAQAGLATCAVLEATEVGGGEWSVIALDTDSREGDEAAAVARVRRALRGVGAEDVLFKKVDSTLRGHPGAELGAVAAVRPGACVLAAPAFPATGRTTRGGRVRLDGRPLEATEFAAQVASSDIAERLAPAGLPFEAVDLDGVRSGSLAARLRDGGDRRRDRGRVLVCDAESDADLDAVVAAGRGSGSEVIWLGSAGLARRLAAAGVLSPGPGGAGPGSGRARGGVAAVRPACPVLLVVGSPAAATAAQLERLRAERGLRVVEASAGGRGDSRCAAAVRATLASGEDCVLTLAGSAGARHAGREGSRALARVAAEAAGVVGGLVLTGGETARAVLEALEVSVLRLTGELAPGIALGYTEDGRGLAVAVKAGGFGSEDALVDCRQAMRGAR